MNGNAQITAAGKAFGRQSASFDEIDDASSIIKWMRNCVYRHVDKWLQPNGRILELNAGTGIDACRFAKKGHQVLATDISDEMLTKLRTKVDHAGLNGMVAVKQCDYTQLHNLYDEGRFDHIFSDFGGLNCVDDFEKVGKHFRNLLKPGGRVTLVMITPFCMWETLLAFKGNFKLAFRRFNSKGSPSQLEGVSFMTYYYWPSELKRGLGKDFKMLSLEGLAVLTPPPYLEGRFSKKLLRGLFKLDRRISRWPLFRRIGDHYIATFQYQP